MPCKKDLRCVDAATGRAKRGGSQWQIQTWVNDHQKEFNKRLIPLLFPRPTVETNLRWVSPLADDKFKEYQDAWFQSPDLYDYANACFECQASTQLFHKTCTIHRVCT